MKQDLASTLDSPAFVKGAETLLCFLAVKVFEFVHRLEEGIQWEYNVDNCDKNASDRLQILTPRPELVVVHEGYHETKPNCQERLIDQDDPRVPEDCTSKFFAQLS